MQWFLFHIPTTSTFVTSFIFHQFISFPCIHFFHIAPTSKPLSRGPFLHLLLFHWSKVHILPQVIILMCLNALLKENSSPFPLSLEFHFPLLKILLRHHSLCCVYIKEIVLENNLSWGLQEKCIRRVRAGFGARIASFLRKSTKYNWWWSQNDFVYLQDFWWLRLV